MAWMTSYVFESWMMSLDECFKSQKVEGTFNYGQLCHSFPLGILVGVDHLVLNLATEHYYYCFLTT